MNDDIENIGNVTVASNRVQAAMLVDRIKKQAKQIEALTELVREICTWEYEFQDRDDLNDAEEKITKILENKR